MSTMLEKLFQGPPLELTIYQPGSRYYGLALADITLADGRTVRYLRRRFLPDPSALVTTVVFRVVDGDRLDNLSARYLGDPLAAWRIADANGVLRMEEVVEETGRRVRSTLPEGVQGNPND
jgi:hypothetical protein